VVGVEQAYCPAFMHGCKVYADEIELASQMSISAQQDPNLPVAVDEFQLSIFALPLINLTSCGH